MPRTRVITTETEESALDLEAYPEHPLFPLMEDEKSFDVSYVQVTRFEQGVQKWGPALPAEELKSENDILARWGGGQYVLVARGIAKQEGIPGRIKKHRRITLPGKSKPLSDDPTPEEKNLANPEAANANRAAPPASTSSGDMVSLVSLMMQMNQQAADRASQQNQQFMQMFLAMMTNGKSDSQAMVQMMLQMTQQSQASMMGLISTVMANRGGGPEEMAKYAELLRSLGVGGASGVAKDADGKGPESVGSMLENAADVIQGLVALKGGPVAPAGVLDPNGMPQQHADLLGGAASLLRGANGGG